MLVTIAAGIGLMPGGRVSLDGNLYAGLAFFTLTFWSGRGLLRREAWAVGTATAVRLMQTCSLAILNGPVFAVRAGPAIEIRLNAFEVAASAGMQASFFVGTRVQGPAWEVTLNLVALAWAATLLAHRRRLRAPVAGSEAGSAADSDGAA